MRPALLACLVSVIVLVEGCELRHGCKIQGGACTCALGCKSEYPYSTQRECRNVLKERGTNICARAPCLNKGTCIQIAQEPGFRCRCEGTGFYGIRCEKMCTLKANGEPVSYACIVI